MIIRKIDAQEPVATKKLRVAAYCRVSTENADQKESLEAQKAHYEAWIKRHSDWEFAGVFYDFGISGTKADSRDGLQALLYSLEQPWQEVSRVAVPDQTEAEGSVPCKNGQ